VKKKDPTCVTSNHLTARCFGCHTRPETLHVFTEHSGTPMENVKFFCRECCPIHGQPLLDGVQGLGSPVGTDSVRRSARGR
jgi:hypothetical protein